MSAEVHLFVVWSEARAAERRILEDAAARFRLLDLVEVTWSARGVLGQPRPLLRLGAAARVGEGAALRHRAVPRRGRRGSAAALPPASHGPWLGARERVGDRRPHALPRVDGRRLPRARERDRGRGGARPRAALRPQERRLRGRGPGPGRAAAARRGPGRDARLGRPGRAPPRARGHIGRLRHSRPSTASTSPWQ